MGGWGVGISIEKTVFKPNFVGCDNFNFIFNFNIIFNFNFILNFNFIFDFNFIQSAAVECRRDSTSDNPLSKWLTDLYSIA